MDFLPLLASTFINVQTMVTVLYATGARVCDKTSAIDLSCSDSIRWISITDCNDVYRNLQRILTSSHVVQVFCGDLKCVFIFFYICVYCSSYDIFYMCSFCNCYFFKSFPLGLPTSGMSSEIGPKMTTTIRESSSQDVKVKVQFIN